MGLCVRIEITQTKEKGGGGEKKSKKPINHDSLDQFHLYFRFIYNEYITILGKVK